MAKKKKHKGSGNAQEVQNAAKTLFANIRFQSVDNPIKSLLITSTVPNEGKTATAALLAQAIASSGLRVLLVECDMRRRSMAAELNAHATHGLYSVLSGEVSVQQAAIATMYPMVQFLDAEPGIPNPAELLSSKRMQKLVTTLESMYDYVIYDTPPVGTFIDAAVLSTLVDGVIIAVRPNTAKRTELMGAYEQLSAANANILGLCATFAEGTGSEYYYAYYTKEGKRVRRSERSSGSDGASMQAPAGQAFRPVPVQPAAEAEAVQAQPAAQAAQSARAQQQRQATGSHQRVQQQASTPATGANGQAVLPGRGRRK